MKLPPPTAASGNDRCESETTRTLGVEHCGGGWSVSPRKRLSHKQELEHWTRQRAVARAESGERSEQRAAGSGEQRAESSLQQSMWLICGLEALRAVTRQQSYR